LLILYGQDDPTLRDINKKRPNVTSIKVPIPTPFGVHHTKMMLMFYTDKSMRIVVSTANLYEDDWDNRVQGLWISERLPPLADGVSHTTHGESATKFREDLTRYLIKYDLPKLQPIIARIRGIDFQSVNVFFVASTPGSHRDDGKGIHFGHPRLATLLTHHSAPIDDSSPIILQASSIGSLGSSAAAYLTGEITASFRKDSAPVGLRRMPNVKFVYPSLNNVLSSHDGMAGGGCLPYNGSTHEKQPWLNDYLCQWKASSRHRNSAMPHIKSYCRYSDRGLFWFVLTSANVSRAAWGILSKNKQSLNTSLRINSYEAGVVFFPRVIIGKDRFPMNEAQQKDDTPIFKLPFDVPLTPYAKHDVPYCAEYLKAYLAKYGAQ
jgi:tyrosyl-DNA phosphodiesterase-1